VELPTEQNSWSWYRPCHGAPAPLDWVKNLGGYWIWGCRLLQHVLRRCSQVTSGDCRAASLSNEEQGIHRKVGRDTLGDTQVSVVRRVLVTLTHDTTHVADKRHLPHTHIRCATVAYPPSGEYTRYTRFATKAGDILSHDAKIPKAHPTRQIRNAGSRRRYSARNSGGTKEIRVTR
jgi:hypothetical protein